MRKTLFFSTALAALALAGCAGNLTTGMTTPIAVPTGGCTIHFDGSWDCMIGGAGGPVPEAVVPVTPAPPPVVDQPAEPVDQPSAEPEAPAPT